MCTRSSGDQQTPTPAPAPAAPLPPAEEPKIGDSRKKESRDAFGADVPTYRVNRQSVPKVSPGDQIKM